MFFLLPLGLVIIATVLSSVFGFTILILPSDANVHFGLITINSIFAGFLYTNYSLLIDFSEKDIAKKVSRTQIMPKRNRHITFGIIYSIISILSGIFLSLDYSDEINNFAAKHFNWISYSLYCSEIIHMIFGIAFFAISMYEMHMLIKSSITDPSKLDDNIKKKITEQLNKGKAK